MPLPHLLLALLAVSGPELVAQFQCQRCHDGLAAAPPIPVERHCVHCHQEIEAGTFDAPAEVQAGWRPNLVSLRFAPDLSELGGHLRPEWVEGFLLAPIDLRPQLLATMPRLPITPPEAKILARHLVGPPSVEQPAPAPSEVEQGRVHFLRLGCGECHAYSGVLPGRGPLSSAELLSASAAKLLAPNLAHTRTRLRPEALPTLLQTPRKLRAKALMPDYTLSPEEVSALVAFVRAAPITPVPEAPPKVRLPLLSRRVSFPEIKTKIFQRHCRHCHADPDKAFGDGGPGNEGGLGYAGRGLSLVDYRAVQSGGRDDQGRRRSIFAPLPDGTPRLIAHLLARREEERGRVVPGIVGMPLGLPSLDEAELQLLESWISQGRPP
jgi:mono/diheme cytochrome c family protein